MPSKPKVIKNLDGQFCATPANSLQRWKPYFNAVLNTSSVFSNEVVDSFSLYMLYVMS